MEIRLYTSKVLSNPNSKPMTRVQGHQLMLSGAPWKNTKNDNCMSIVCSWNKASYSYDQAQFSHRGSRTKGIRIKGFGVRGPARKVQLAPPIKGIYSHSESAGSIRPPAVAVQYAIGQNFIDEAFSILSSGKIESTISPPLTARIESNVSLSCGTVSEVN